MNSCINASCCNYLVNHAIVGDLEAYVNHIVHSSKVLFKVRIASVVRYNIRFQQNANRCFQEIVFILKSKSII